MRPDDSRTAQTDVVRITGDVDTADRVVRGTVDYDVSP